MIDLKQLRENPEAIQKGINTKKFDCDIQAILELDRKRRVLINEAETLRSKQKSANADMAQLKKGSPEFLEKVQEMKAVAAEVKEAQAQLDELEQEWNRAY